MGDAEVSEDAEGEIEEADVEGGEGFEDGDLWDGEIGDEPEGAGGSVCGKLMCEGLDFGLGEAVEEEVGDDEVCFRGGSDGEGGGLVGPQTVGMGPAAAAKEVEHGGAGVYGGGLEIGLLGEETGEEAAVSVAEEEGLMAGRELREEVGARSLQEGAEGEIFGEAVDAGHGVEVGRLVR